MVGSWPFRTSAVCSTTTNVARLTLACRVGQRCRAECCLRRRPSIGRSMRLRPTNSWRPKTPKATRRGESNTPIAAFAGRVWASAN